MNKKQEGQDCPELLTQIFERTIANFRNFENKFITWLGDFDFEKVSCISHFTIITTAMILMNQNSANKFGNRSQSTIS